MKLYIILSLSLTAAFALPGNQTDDGDVEIGAKIIGGYKSTLGLFPYQVVIFHDVDNNHQVCGGSILNNRWILTAGHCVYNANNYQIVAGATELYATQSTKQFFGVSEAHVHPDYNKPASLNNDVAVLKVDRDIVFNDYVKQIRISRANDYLKEDVHLIISGWGKIADSQQYVNSYLKYAELISITNDKCKTYFQAPLVPNYVLCAQGKGTDSPCSGDSGGPLIKIDTDGQRTQVGVFSFISVSGCEKKYPSGFSRIPYFLPFIQKYVNVWTN